MAFRQHSPDLCAEAECVGQDLEHDVALRRTKPLIAEGSQTQRVGRAVREVESAIEGVRLVLGVFETRHAGADETRKLRAIGRLMGEDATRTGEAVKRGMSCSPPMIHTFGCARIRVTKEFLALDRLVHSATEYTVGLIGRPRARPADSSASNTSP